MDTSSGPGRRIVVGVDGSANAARALRWAAQEASHTARTLRVVNVWAVPNTSWGAVASAYVDPVDIQEGARNIVQRAIRTVRRELDGEAPDTEQVTVNGQAADGLRRAAEGASMLVVGTRGRGGFASLVLGSVAMACAEHSAVPVVVVGAEAPQPGSGDIVVGIDDSVGGRTALRWAVEEAVRAGVGLRVVHGWDFPAVVPANGPLMGPLEIADGVREHVEASVADAIADIEVHPPITVQAIPLPAPEALLQEAKGAALLVVGSRGRGGFAGLLLGSVSQQCLHHSPCPVVVVPTPEAR